MNRKSNAVAAGLAATALLALAGCSGGGSAKVSGLRDDVKTIKAVKAVPAKTHAVSSTKQERYCTSRKNGSCKAWGTRTVPTTKTVTDVPAKPGKPAMYCVELDNVNGKPTRDDRWFEVSSATYAKMAKLNEGAKVTNMKYHRELTACTR